MFVLNLVVLIDFIILINCNCKNFFKVLIILGVLGVYEDVDWFFIWVVILKIIVKVEVRLVVNFIIEFVIRFFNFCCFGIELVV